MVSLLDMAGGDNSRVSTVMRLTLWSLADVVAKWLWSNNRRTRSGGKSNWLAPWMIPPTAG